MFAAKEMLTVIMGRHLTMSVEALGVRDRRAERSVGSLRPEQECDLHRQ